MRVSRHPLFRSKYTARAYAVGWIPLGIMYRFLLVFSGHLTHLESMALVVPLVILLAAACTVPWYTCRYLPITSTSPWKAIGGHLITTMWMSAIVMALMHWVATAWSPVFPALPAKFSTAAPALTVTVALTYLLATALHYVVQAVEASREAEIQSREAQLKALKAQVNPHFLFNSLNSISALTAVNPARARDMCIKLSDFLRNSLRLGERTSIPFGEELALTKTYLDVEQVRFGDRLRVRQKFDDDCADCDVPPLILQPLVENSIKHGIATLVDGGEIEISGRRAKDAMRIVVDNPFDPDAPSVGKNGFGLVNVRNRIQARWGAAAKMDIQVDRNRYRVTLFFPYERDKKA
jgi:two-component system, LytTR family, sensor histidine kinase AlgZ